MRFGIIVDYKLRKAICIGALDNQQLSLSAAGNYGS